MILRPVHNLLYEEFLVVNNRKYYVDLTASYFFDLMMLHEFLFTNYLFYLKNNESIFIFKTSTPFYPIQGISQHLKSLWARLG